MYINTYFRMRFMIISYINYLLLLLMSHFCFSLALVLYLFQLYEKVHVTWIKILSQSTSFRNTEHVSKNKFEKSCRKHAGGDVEGKRPWWCSSLIA